MNNLQLTDTVLMVRPNDFSFNEQTATDNEFQNIPDESADIINQKAMNEFSEMVNKLKLEGINVLVLEKSNQIKTPDAVFPNNWISTEHDGTIITYPMATPNRRDEKKQLSATEKLLKEKGFKISNIVNIGSDNEEKLFLEGTGSMIIDHYERTVYVAESVRSNPQQLENFCKQRNYKSILFQAKSSNNKPVYHTNVIMSIADKFAVICSDSIYNHDERQNVLDNLSKNHEIIHISFEQMEKSFCGNVLQLKNINNEPVTVMSESAYKGFTKEQLETIIKYGKIISVNIDTIEKVGGGSARCMMAEVFLEKN